MRKISAVLIGLTVSWTASGQSDFRSREVLPATTTAAPSITPGGIVPVGSTVTTIEAGEWVSIYGRNLATSTVTSTGNFPTSLGGTKVTVNGKAAYLLYVSAGQIDFQSPADTATGTVAVVVTTAAGTATANVTLAEFAPSMALADTTHVAGIILRPNGTGAYGTGSGSYDYLSPAIPAKSGDIVELFGFGFGPTNPAVTPGQVYAGAAPTISPVKLLINNVSVTPIFAGLSSAGDYQFNLVIPPGLGTGDVPLVATVGGAQSQANVVISLQDAVVTPQVQSLTLSSNSVVSGGTLTGTVTLSAAAPAGGATITLSTASSSVATVPASVAIPAGNSTAAFTVTVGTVSSSSQTVTITASYAGSSAQASLTVTPAVNPLCTNVGGNWNVTETGSESETLSAAGEIDSGTVPVSGSENIVITQTGCSIQYNPVVESSLTGTSLTASQIAQLVRTGTVSGNSVTVTGELALLSVVESQEEQANPGLSVTSASVTNNLLTATGQVSGNVMTLTETGQFTASGTFSYSGENGSYSLTITTSSTAVFDYATGTQAANVPGTVGSMKINVRTARNAESAARQEGIAEMLRAVFSKALIFGGR